MSSAPEPAPIDRALRRAHRSILVALAMCAIVIFSQGESGDAPPERAHALVAVGLALATIVSRRFATSPAMGIRSQVTLFLTSFACALAIGVVGVVITAAGGERQTGLIFVMAAAIFSLRPPPKLVRPDS